MCKTDLYTLEAYMLQTNQKNEWKDLVTKLKNSIGDGAFFDENEVILILTALAHASGIEHAFQKMFRNSLREDGD